MKDSPIITLNQLSYLLDLNDLLVRDNKDKIIPFRTEPLKFDDISEIRFTVDTSLKFEELDKLGPNKVRHTTTEELEFREDFTIEYRLSFELFSIFLEKNRKGDYKYYHVVRYTGTNESFTTRTIFELFLTMGAFNSAGDKLFDIVH